MSHPRNHCPDQCQEGETEARPLGSPLKSQNTGWRPPSFLSPRLDWALPALTVVFQSSSSLPSSLSPVTPRHRESAWSHQHLEAGKTEDNFSGSVQTPSQVRMYNVGSSFLFLFPGREDRRWECPPNCFVLCQGRGYGRKVP